MKDLTKIPGLEDYYLNKQSDIYSLKKGRWRKMTKTKLNTGYLQVKFSEGGKPNKYSVHRLIAATFLGLDLDSKLHVCHKNDVRDDNRIENLFIGSHQDNVQDCVKKRRHCYGSKIGTSKLTEEDIIEIRKLISEGYTNKQIGEKFGVHSSNISIINTKKGWAHV